MKYKVGDKVLIKSIDWYNKNKDIRGIVRKCGFVMKMAEYCGQIATIMSIVDGHYDLDIDNGIFYWTDEMFEENIKDMKTKEIVLPEGWEVDKIENGKVILKESKKELLKTWEECYLRMGNGEYIDGFSKISPSKLTNPNESNFNLLPKDMGKPMLALCQLLICRDVYRQGWKPDYRDGCIKYCIIVERGEIVKSRTFVINNILSFKSPEVRDEFLKNFRDLIEEAKELL